MNVAELLGTLVISSSNVLCVCGLVLTFIVNIGNTNLTN
jgi:hypothetical protein